MLMLNSTNSKRINEMGTTHAVHANISTNKYMYNGQLLCTQGITYINFMCKQGNTVGILPSPYKHIQR